MSFEKACGVNFRDHLPAPKQITDLFDAFRSSKAVFAACELEIFDYLHGAESPQSAKAISSQLGLNHAATVRLLDTLVCLEFLIREKNTSSCSGDPLYRNTETSTTFLRKESADSMFGIIMTINTVTYPLFSNLHHAVRDGSNQWMRTFNLSSEEQWKAFYSNEATCHAFTEGMQSSMLPDAARVLTAFDLSSFEQICDLGGGSGALAYTLCQCYPNSKVTVLDLPMVIKLAPRFRPRLEDCPNQSNVEFKAGDFVTGELPSADLYILARILHDWDDKNVDLILSNVFKSLPSGGGLLICELLLDDDSTGPLNALLMSLTMLVMTEGSERTAAEYKTLLEKHGFREVKAKRVNSVSCDVVFCRKP